MKMLFRTVAIMAENFKIFIAITLFIILKYKLYHPSIKTPYFQMSIN